MLSKNTLLFFLLFTYYCIGEQDFCPESTESFRTPLQNGALVGYVIKSLLTRGIFSCAHKCLSHLVFFLQLSNFSSTRWRLWVKWWKRKYSPKPGEKTWICFCSGATQNQGHYRFFYFKTTAFPLFALILSLLQELLASSTTKSLILYIV